MSLSAPKQLTFIIAVVLAVIGLIFLGFIVLAIGCLVPNL